jgi:hypothetical protein
MCSDEDVNAGSGVHVIQTFLSESLSEEIQIQGRTARQDNPGTYCMVLNAKTLADCGVSAADVEDMHAGSKKLYGYISPRRILAFDANFPEKTKTVDASAKEHAKSMELISHLLQCRTDPKSRAYCHARIKELNCCPDGEDMDGDARRYRRTVVLLDGTGSMGHALAMTKQRLAVVFQRAFDIIQQALGPSTGFQMQLGVYRNYNVDQEWKLFQHTDFEGAPANLVQFLSDVRVDGGISSEAAELGLAHALRMHEADPVGQVVVIGDAPPHSRQESQTNHARRHPALASMKRFPHPVFFDEVKRELEAASIRVSTVYVPTGGSAAWRKGFHAMATADGFQTDLQDLHANAAESAAMLTDCITTSILEMLGRERGGTASKDMVEMYKRLYGHGHTS